MGNFKYSRTTCDTVKIKGVLSASGDEITYTNGGKGNEEEFTVNILDYLRKYAGEEVTFGLTTKEELDLEEG